MRAITAVTFLAVLSLAAATKLVPRGVTIVGGAAPSAALTDTPGGSCSTRSGQCMDVSQCTGAGVLVLGLCPGTAVCCYQAWSYVADGTSTPDVPPNPTTPVDGRRGTIVHLLMGLGDEATSPGILTQSNTIRQMGTDVETTVWTWKAWPEVVRRFIADNNQNKHVVIGYSCGASAVEYVADSNVALDLAVSEDPTIWLSTTPFRSNVAQAICFHNTNPINPVGRASCECGDGFPQSRLNQIDTADLHGNVDTDPAIVNVVMNAVQAIVQAP